MAVVAVVIVAAAAVAVATTQMEKEIGVVVGVGLGNNSNYSPSTPIIVNLTMKDTKGNIIPYDFQYPPASALGVLFAYYTIPGKALPGNFTVTAKAPYDPEYKPVTKSYQAVYKKKQENNDN